MSDNKDVINAEEAEKKVKKRGRPHKSEGTEQKKVYKISKPRVRIKKKSSDEEVKETESSEMEQGIMSSEPILAEESNVSLTPDASEESAETALSAASESSEELVKDEKESLNAPGEEGQSEENPIEDAQKEKKEGRERYSKGKKNNKRKEEYPQEVNLDENPDAPKMYISVLAVKSIDEIRAMAREMGIAEDVILDSRKTDLIYRIMRMHSAAGGALMVEGVLEIIQDGGYGYIRYSINNYLPGSEDVYISTPMIKQKGLKTGDLVHAQIRAPREGEKAAAVIRVISVNNDDVKMAKLRAPFDSLTPLFADERLHLEVIKDNEPSDLSCRVVDLFCPIGKGQRSLIVAPPRTGKTVLMQKIANAITTNHPEVYLIVLLIDERPEEVTDMKRNVNAEVVASTFDEVASHHVRVAEMVIEKAKRMVEYKKDVVILLDSITRLARAYNQTVPASGKILSGGVDSNALHMPKRFFGAARNIEQGGSLTIISTALIETGSRMDEVIFEEFKGTGNNEIVLDRKMADNRKFPAINIKKSGTRREDLLLPEDVLTRVILLRSAFGQLDDIEMSTTLIDKMRKNNNNKEFLESMNLAAARN